MIKGFFKIIILKKLNERDRSGYDLIKEIESLFEKKPSAGSIYPMLKDLLGKEMITCKEEDRRKIYSITKKGKETFERLLKEKEEMIVKHIGLVRILKDITGEDIEHNKELFENVKFKEELFLKNISVWMSLKKTIEETILDKNEERQKRAVALIENATSQLKNIYKKREE
ncbi:MAG: hypothetical protein DRN66_03130 [Candidatus Nanohalarchaeota archaeon]|nr:MAG: hypothetical protein DRN66_03130 [Candidatus Nanohaloarchaeota archaeon]